MNVPRYCVWELTLACNARCVHCGSTAGRARNGELDTSEALDVVRQLAELGCEVVTFSGGEPLLRKDWLVLAKAVSDEGMQPEMISNGFLVEQQLDAIVEAQFASFTMSVDGADAATHDELRGITDSHEHILRGARLLSERGINVGAVTQINRRNVAQLSEIFEVLRTHGFGGWQLQLTMPHGRARHQKHESETLCLDPDALPGIEKTILELKDRAGPFLIQVSDNIGYMSRKEPKLRSDSLRPDRVWMGCGAGLSVIGLTSDGTVRGCLSLPSELDEPNGNVRQRPLAEIWNDPNGFSYNREFNPTQLTGPCKDCPFGRICRGGCTSMAFATTGTTTANHHCLHRVGCERKPG